MSTLLVIIFTILFLSINKRTDAASFPTRPERLTRSKLEQLRNYTAISEFRVLNRRYLIDCPDPNPYLQLNTTSGSGPTLSDDEYVTVNITGVLLPSSGDWVAMISPSHSDVGTCVENAVKYEQTGDFSSLPLLCHYPVKAQYVRNDPDYLSCSKQECKKYVAGECVLTTCGATLSFHVVNIRTDIEFVLFGGGFETPCIFKRSDSVSFDNPNMPLYGHISSPDSTGTSMKLSDSVGWSDEIRFKTAPGGGSDELKFLAYGDMGKAPLDSSAEHYIQPGSISVTKAMADEVSSGKVDSIFHIGDISYATGFLVEWDFFLHQITPLASQVSYMTAIGNHERDYVNSGSVYSTPDSGGECGVPYETYFPMPTQAKDKPWYSIEQGSVHFTVISTEHDWTVNSEQYDWMNKDMATVDRTRTPWLIFTGHRPMYTSSPGNAILPSVDTEFVADVEPLLLANKVDLALFGHVHNYERTCAVYKQECKAMPTKDGNGIDTYDNSNYTAPVHAVIGMAGFTLDGFTQNDNIWSLSRVSEFGYVRVHATKNELSVEFVNADSRNTDDNFQIVRS
ncbi:hypothetical protein ABFS82_04G077900 [Erythranthe guttata]|nr:PREDICTED: probable inactive purple acid phosphatase 27 [Erythranthe guttata]|eukprot:XP_012835336.1 PREDICTED: probable inactive purple acid phosphatase 27 [Erythranthe guttata]